MYQLNKVEKENKRMNIALKIVSILLYLFIIPILLVNIFLIIQTFHNPNKIPDLFGYKNFVIVSKSMEPTINKGDAIFVKNALKEDIHVNDIISFHDEENILITHRVAKIIYENGTSYYITKGDNNIFEDKEKIAYDKIEGVYQFKLNGFGYLIEFLQNKFVLISLFTILILNYWYFRRIKKRRNFRKEKKKLYRQSRIEKEEN